MPLKGPEDYWVEYGDTVLTLHFTLPLKTPVDPGAKGVTVDVYDPSFFVAFGFAERNPVKVGGMAPGCTAKVDAPDAESAEAAKALSEAFFSQLGANSNYGSQFAQTALVKCEPRDRRFFSGFVLALVVTMCAPLASAQTVARCVRRPQRRAKPRPQHFPRPASPSRTSSGQRPVWQSADLDRSDPADHAAQARRDGEGLEERQCSGGRVLARLGQLCLRHRSCSRTWPRQGDYLVLRSRQSRRRCAAAFSSRFLQPQFKG